MKPIACSLAAALLAALGSTACTRHAATAPTPLASPGAVPATTGCLPSHDGYLRARLRGASNLDINWADGQMHCEGDPRPDHHGIRMTFAGRAQPGNHQLRFVFGIDTPAARGVARDLPANITVIFEGEHRLYSTLGAGKCSVDQLRQEPIRQHAGLLRVSARGFCINPAAVVGSAAGKPAADAEVLLSRFDFSGVVLATAGSRQR